MSISVPQTNGQWQIIKIGTIHITEVGLNVTIEIPDWEMLNPSSGQRLVTMATSTISFTRDPYFGTTVKHLDHLLIGGYSINELIKISQGKQAITNSVQKLMNQTIGNVGGNIPDPDPVNSSPDPIDPPTPGKPRRPRPKFGWYR